MGSQLNPYLMFNGDAAQGMEFYRSVLGGDLTSTSFAEAGGGEGPPGVMHAQLVTEAGYTLMASDPPPGEKPRTEASKVSLSLSGDDGERLRSAFDGLADGGTVHLPLDRQTWGDVFGMVTDRFGFDWMVNISDPG